MHSQEKNGEPGEPGRLRYQPWLKHFFQVHFQLHTAHLGSGSNTQGSQKAVQGSALGSYIMGITYSPRTAPQQRENPKSIP